MSVAPSSPSDAWRSSTCDTQPVCSSESKMSLRCVFSSCLPLSRSSFADFCFTISKIFVMASDRSAPAATIGRAGAGDPAEGEGAIGAVSVAGDDGVGATPVELPGPRRSGAGEAGESSAFDGDGTGARTAGDVGERFSSLPLPRLVVSEPFIGTLMRCGRPPSGPPGVGVRVSLAGSSAVRDPGAARGSSMTGSDWPAVGGADTEAEIGTELPAVDVGAAAAAAAVGEGVCCCACICANTSSHFFLMTRFSVGSSFSAAQLSADEQSL